MPDATRNPLCIVLLDRKALPADIHFRAFSFAHELVQFDQTGPDEVPERIKDADIVITNKAPAQRLQTWTTFLQPYYRVLTAGLYYVVSRTAGSLRLSQRQFFKAVITKVSCCSFSRLMKSAAS